MNFGHVTVNGVNSNQIITLRREEIQAIAN